MTGIWDSTGLIHWRKPSNMYFERCGAAEIGNLDKPDNTLHSTADIEIRRGRNTIFGNPFNAFWDKHGSYSGVADGTFRRLTVEEWHREACDALQRYMFYILDEERNARGRAPVEEMAKKRLIPLIVDTR